jgi:hypothetical protein
MFSQLFGDDEITMGLLEVNVDDSTFVLTVKTMNAMFVLLTVML